MTSRRLSTAGAFALAKIALVASGCAGTDDDAAANAERPVAQHACSEFTRDSPPRPARDFGLVRGDVDGNGSLDRVFISFLRRAPPSCRYLLAADLGSNRVAVAPIRARPWLSQLTRARARDYLWLSSLISLAPRGLHVVVNIERGATTDSLAIYELRGRTFVRLKPRGAGPDYVFLAGGGVNNAQALDCGGSRLIISSSVSPHGSAWRVQRRVFHASARGELAPVAQLSAQEVVRRYDWIAARFPEFAGGGIAFKSCALARTKPFR
jgi:hypothetical protein